MGVALNAGRGNPKRAPLDDGAFKKASYGPVFLPALNMATVGSMPPLTTRFTSGVLVML